MGSVAAPILTLGHSNHSFEAFCEMLAAGRVELLVDIRAFPGSRRQPQFSQDALRDSLRDVRIEYTHRRDLGGRRKADPEVRSEGLGDGWRNASFRAYAEYAQSTQYLHALDELVALSHDQRVAIMCSEAVPWRCHRWLVSDTLVARGEPVFHVLSPSTFRRHEVSPFAVVDHGTVTWPGPPSELPLRLGPPVLR